MISTTNKKEFMTTHVVDLLKQIPTDRIPNFGLMTPQHMVEHLAWTLKGCVKRNGEPENPPTKGQLGFKAFIDNGAILEHRPKGKTKNDLPPLKYDNIEEAIEQVGVAIERFYTHYKNNPDFKCYNSFFGELGFEDLEKFTYMHYRYHLWQFDIIKSYPQER